MIPDRVLDLAVGQGLIAAGQAASLRSLARQEAAPARPEPIDEERLRFVTGFADIFVTIGLALFLGALAYLLDGLPEGLTASLVAATCWGLAEFFTRHRRMALPSIVLLCAFAFAVYLAAASLGVPARGPESAGWFDVLVIWQESPATSAVAALVAAAASALYYGRFRVPITVAAGVAALGLTVFMVLRNVAPDTTARLANPILLGLGLAAFALAMRFDLSDPERLSRRTDIAFWLHMLAAPLIVHSLFAMLGVTRGQIPPGAALVVLLIFAALALVAVIVDRRAILVSGLVYAGIALVSLVNRTGLDASTSTPLTLLALGAFVLLLSAAWAPLRNRLLRIVPPALVDRLPRPVSPS